jgi:hypothetical protein
MEELNGDPVSNMTPVVPIQFQWTMPDIVLKSTLGSEDYSIESESEF